MSARLVPTKASCYHLLFFQLHSVTEVKRFDMILNCHHQGLPGKKLLNVHACINYSYYCYDEEIVCSLTVRVSCLHDHPLSKGQYDIGIGSYLETIYIPRQSPHSQERKPANNYITICKESSSVLLLPLNDTVRMASRALSRPLLNKRVPVQKSH